MKTVTRIRTKKRGKTWSYAFEAGKTPEGKRRTIERGGFPSESEAYDAGVTAYTDFKHGNIGITSEHITLGEYLDVWLKSIAGTVSTGTLYGYGSVCGKIKRYIGHLILQELRPRDVETLIAKLYAEGISRSTLQGYKTILSTALKYAIYPAELISSNPAYGVKVPRNAPTGLVKREIITPDKFKEVMEIYPLGHAYHIPLYIAYYTGMRISEIIGLEWQDIDLEQRIIHLTKQVKIVTGKGYAITKLKNEASERDICFGETLAERLSLWKEMQAQLRLEGGGAYVIQLSKPDNFLISCSKSMLNTMENLTERNFVCTRHNGKLVLATSLEHDLQKKGFNTHSFRHTHTTLLIENGATPKEVASRLGHRTDTITQEVYLHVTKSMRQRLVDIFERAINHQHK